MRIPAADAGRHKGINNKSLLRTGFREGICRGRLLYIMAYLISIRYSLIVPREVRSTATGVPRLEAFSV